MSISRRPHILLITTDQQRGDALGLNGNPYVETPNLDALAVGGLNFSKAYVTCPVCIPARRTLISGMSPDSHGLRRYRDGLEFDPPATLPGCLSAAGYQTQLIGKMHLHPQGKRYGFDNILLSETSNWRPHCPTQRRNDYVDWLRGKGVMDHPHSHGISGNGRLARPWGLEERFNINAWMVEEAVKFLTEKRDPACPVFLHLSFVQPHPPLVPIQHYFERYLNKELPRAVLGDWCPPYRGERRKPDSPIGPFDPEIIRRAIAAYYALISHVDDSIASILEQWLGYGSPWANDPVYILFSSDHGEMLGQHQLFRKSLGYEASARVPFFISGYNVPLEKGNSDALVCWEDVAPTLLDLAGVEIPPSMEGKSLAPLLRGEDGAVRREYLFGQCEGPLHNLWIATGRWKYLWFPKTNEEQLFDLAADPTESHDLSGEETPLKEMRVLMREQLRNRQDLEYNESLLRPCCNRPPRIFWPEQAQR